MPDTVKIEKNTEEQALSDRGLAEGMESEVVSDQEVVRQGSGSILAAARKQQNMTIEQVAQDLNLSVSQIKALELDLTDGLPEPTYVRGYIRGYAKLLKLDPDDVLQNYLNPNWRKNSDLNDIPYGMSNNDETRFGGMVKIVKILLGLALIVVGLLLWQSGAFDSFTSLRTVNTEVEQKTDVSNDSATINDAVSNTSATAQPQANDPMTGEAENVDIPVVETDSIESITENFLVLTFTETSWVDIRDQDDQKLAYKSYTVGETIEIREAGDMTVLIGNDDGVTVSLNGEPFDLTPHQEGAYVKFVVDGR